MMNTWSRNSDTSAATSSSINLNRIFNYLLPHIPGLYKISSKTFTLEYSENTHSTNLSFRYRKPVIFPELIEQKTIDHGIEYSAKIKILHENDECFFILVPEFRSYDPAGLEKPYLAFEQHLFMLKLVSAEVRAASLGISEDKIEIIHRFFEENSAIYQNIKEMCEWMLTQVKCACFRKVEPPKYYEMILSKIATNRFDINKRNHCKEYIEKCLRGNEFILPKVYYKSVVRNEPKLAFDKKIKYFEAISKSKYEDPTILNELSKVAPQLAIVRKGKTILSLLNDIEKHYLQYTATEELSKCVVL